MSTTSHASKTMHVLVCMSGTPMTCMKWLLFLQCPSPCNVSIKASEQFHIQIQLPILESHVTCTTGGNSSPPNSVFLQEGLTVCKRGYTSARGAYFFARRAFTTRRAGIPACPASPAVKPPGVPAGMPKVGTPPPPAKAGMPGEGVACCPKPPAMDIA